MVSEGVREACATDARRLAEIDALQNPGPWSETLFRDSIAAGQCRLAVDASGRICGFVVFQTVLDECEILGIAVEPGQQRRGIGTRLLSAALAEARAQGARACYLEVRVSNEAAQSLYLAHGFVPNGLRKAYYGAGAAREDALLLRLEMAAREP
ncbi:MAG: ribosomal protein S18-alanine N-acetyltransferase [Gammaproteobacteria bacterium]|nr:ribosomal protein S18-alanine N-acetyltransferase [Gammaproteobacteria bacterium]MBP6050488.1 ribosomal protein S18-alanine N-acetyltransferase [Pseudomonadales bacterium]MBK6583593.1 ribosomal protein S18-alanine N-acetyltransferase [Gammaproteobacteria bacterium]MBK7169901.1 ribosomal protein S18-alanine N-acetyltransferase [Gammaproteobacteria bacterium]MBK7521931.1 ribosomal protein S18-alanine N-acetyltransferase [Gammaproteobacteria bacterium]